MSRHAMVQEKQKDNNKKWPWVIGIIVLVLLALAVTLGIAGSKVYSESKQVQAHEQKALNLIGNVDISSMEALDTLQSNLPEIQKETGAAQEIAHGAAWNIISVLPFIGNDIKTTQGMTSVFNNLVQSSIPKFLSVITNLKNAHLTGDDGSVNLQPIVDNQKTIKIANNELQNQVKAYNQLPPTNISKITGAYEQGKIKLEGIAEKVNQLSNAFEFIPQFLGKGAPQHYAVMALTTSEMRSIGGLVGSVGEMTTDNGNVSVGDFRANGEYLPFGTADTTEDERRIYQAEGPLHMSFDIRDLATFPDIARTAEGMRTIWNRTEWGKKAPLSGIVMTDPVFVQELIRINGNVHLPNGETLNGDNTAEYLLNTVYKQYPGNNESDLIFASVAQQCIGDMFKNIDFNKLLKTSMMMGQMAKDRHFSLYSFDEKTEASIRKAGFSPSTPDNEETPTVGVYLTEQNPSKMGWYVKRSSKIARDECKKDGSQTYHVEYTLNNTLNPADVDNLPKYITGFGDSSGFAMEKVLLYPPAGGSITNMNTVGKAGGSSSKPIQTTMNGKTAYETVVKVGAGQSVTLSFDVTTSPRSKEDLAIDQTPLGWISRDDEIDVTACNMK